MHPALCERQLHGAQHMHVRCRLHGPAVRRRHLHARMQAGHLHCAQHVQLQSVVAGTALQSATVHAGLRQRPLCRVGRIQRHSAHVPAHMHVPDWLDGRRLFHSFVLMDAARHLVSVRCSDLRRPLPCRQCHVHCARRLRLSAAVERRQLQCVQQQLVRRRLQIADLRARLSRKLLQSWRVLLQARPVWVNVRKRHHLAARLGDRHVHVRPSHHAVHPRYITHSCWPISLHRTCVSMSVLR